MNLRFIVGMFAITLASTSVGCGKKEDPVKPADKPSTLSGPSPTESSEKAPEKPAEKPAEQLPPAKLGKWADIPNISGMVADVPNDAEPNGVGGAAGFHKKDETYQWALNEVTPEREKMTAEQAKAEMAEFVKEFKKAEATPDGGFVLVYEMPSMDAEGNVTGTVTAFSRRIKVGSKQYDCGGSVKTPASPDASIASCETVRAK